MALAGDVEEELMAGEWRLGGFQYLLAEMPFLICLWVGERDIDGLKNRAIGGLSNEKHLSPQYYIFIRISSGIRELMEMLLCSLADYIRICSQYDATIFICTIYVSNKQASIDE